jgi:uncharacterized protein YbjT (DUF2867 family)
MEKSIIVTGATGTAGIEVINQALLDNEISRVTALVRKPLKITHPKLKVIIHQDFLSYSGLEEIFKQHDACIWCLGISQTLVSKEEYIKITYDYTLAAAEAILSANPRIAFVFLSGMGADSKEKSRTLFARIKGKTENALQKLSLRKVYIARPGGIIPTTPRDNYHFKERLSIMASKLIKLLVPKMAITADQLAKAMLKMVKQEPNKIIFENKDLLDLLKDKLPN